MKFRKKLAAAFAIGLALVGTAACSNGGNNSSSSSSSDKIAKVKKTTNIVFWHGMTGVQQATLKKLTQEFESKNPKIKVKLENQGAYNDLQAKINSTLQSPNNLPTITQAYPDWLFNAAKKNMLVDLTPYINNKEVGWGSRLTMQICLRNTALRRLRQLWMN